MAYDARTAAYDILERLARNLADCDDRGVGGAIQDGPQHLGALPYLRRAGLTIRMRHARPVRVPRKRIPQHGAIGDTQFVQAPQTTVALGSEHGRARCVMRSVESTRGILSSSNSRSLVKATPEKRQP
jgi:hypothetical protein